MKLIAMLIIVSLVGFTEADQRTSGYKAARNLLDSLQGKWINVEDRYWRWEFKGRKMDDYYTAENIKVHEVYDVYFFDQEMNPDSNFYHYNIDTSAKSGRYMIAKSRKDSGFWCYEINGFFKDKHLNLSVSDTWSKYRTFRFRKVQ